MPELTPALHALDLSRNAALLDEALYSASAVLEKSIRLTEEDGKSGTATRADGLARIEELRSILVSLSAPSSPLSTELRADFVLRRPRPHRGARSANSSSVRRVPRF